MSEKPDLRERDEARAQVERLKDDLREARDPEVVCRIPDCPVCEEGLGWPRSRLLRSRRRDG